MMMNPPSKVWIQWYGEDDGNDIGFDRPEGPTFNTEKVYQNDVCYIRAGKPSPIIGKLQIELRAARFAAEAAEAERDALAAENLDLIAEIVQTNCRDYGKGEYQTQSLVDQDLIDRLVTAGRMRHKRDDNKGRAVYEFVPAPPQE